MQAFHEKFNRFGEWVIRLVILNVLWLGFSVVGLGILGVFPSTSALFSVLRKWFIGQEQVKITRSFPVLSTRLLEKQRAWLQLIIHRSYSLD